MAVPAGVCVPSYSPSSSCAPEVQGRIYQSDSVPFSPPFFDVACQTRSLSSGAGALPVSGHSSLGRLVTEAQLLSAKGLSYQVVETLLLLPCYEGNL